ncbi:MAG: hypothetical protein KF833_19710 [Verrucomicrobiae bacterium]|nr:hypothetical protein [Verrucomicrobiae bacterium]
MSGQGASGRFFNGSKAPENFVYPAVAGRKVRRTDLGSGLEQRFEDGGMRGFGFVDGGVKVSR